MQLCKVQDEDQDLALRILHATLKWLNEKNIRQWSEKSIENRFFDCQTRGENYLVRDAKGVAAVFSLTFQTPDYWMPELEDPDLWFLFKLAVHPKRRGEKIGVETMRLAKTYLQSQKVDSLYLDVVSENHFLRQFYAELDFEELCCKTVDFPTGVSFDMTLMKSVL